MKVVDRKGKPTPDLDDVADQFNTCDEAVAALRALDTLLNYTHEAGVDLKPDAGGISYLASPHLDNLEKGLGVMWAFARSSFEAVTRPKVVESPARSDDEVVFRRVEHIRRVMRETSEPKT